MKFWYGIQGKLWKIDGNYLEIIEELEIIDSRV